MAVGRGKKGGRWKKGGKQTEANRGKGKKETNENACRIRATELWSLNIIQHLNSWNLLVYCKLRNKTTVLYETSRYITYVIIPRVVSRKGQIRHLLWTLFLHNSSEKNVQWMYLRSTMEKKLKSKLNLTFKITAHMTTKNRNWIPLFIHIHFIVKLIHVVIIYHAVLNFHLVTLQSHEKSITTGFNRRTSAFVTNILKQLANWMPDCKAILMHLGSSIPQSNF